MAGKYGPVKVGDAVILYHLKIGFVRGFAREDWEWKAGGLAYFEASINSEVLPGVERMMVNTNQWDVYAADDPEILKKIAQVYVKPFSTR